MPHGHILHSMFTELNDRSRDVLRHIVDSYLETGEAVGSRTLARNTGMNLSPATIRNVMADLEDMGLLYAPHISAGRMPTDAGLRVFIDGMLEIGELSKDEQTAIKDQCESSGQSLNNVLEQASSVLSGLSACAGLVVAPKKDAPLKQIEFVHLGPGRVLAILVNANGLIENRIIELPLDIPASALMAAGNYLNAKLAGNTLSESREEIIKDIEARKSELDDLSQKVVQAGLASWSENGGGHLIVRGQAHLLSNITAVSDLERIRALFEALETRETMLKLVEAANEGEGIQIFIGAENTLFDQSGCSMIISPYKNRESEIIGAIGVIGPTRLNYGRIIPIVNYTSEVVGKLIG